MRSIARSCLYAACVGLSACASAPERLYTLETPISTGSFAQQLPIVALELGPLSDLMDRPQFVVRESDYRLKMLEQARWASPLKEAIPRVLARELNQLDAERAYVVAPTSGNQWRLHVDVVQLDLSMASGVNLQSRWYVAEAAGGSVLAEGRGTRHIDLTVTPPEGFAKALHRALALLASDIAASFPAGMKSQPRR